MPKMSVMRIFILVGFIIYSSSSLAQKGNLPGYYDDIAHNVTKMVEVVHYEEPRFDDAFSARLFHAYFESLDPGKMIFLKEDKTNLARFEHLLDDELRGKKLSFFKVVDTLYARRLEETSNLVKSLLQQPVKFNSDDVYVSDREIVDFPVSPTDKKETWRKFLMYMTLNQYAELTDSIYNQNPEAPLDTVSERKAREAVERIQNRSFERLRQSAKQEEHFGKFLNSMIHLLDPHSNYFLPVEKRGFEEDLSGIYYGIGALLQETEGSVRIAELMIGGPAWRSGQVEKGDVIVELAQSKEVAQNVMGMGMSDIIKLTRGKKGTNLTITFRKPDGKLKKVTLTRDALQLEDTFVRSAIIEDSSRIGYIFLPKFYTSFDAESGRSCAMDIAREIEKLQKESVKGVIIDVRDNGGGSLEEVIRMVGLFIREGPVVQVKSRGKDPEIANIRTQEVAYEGPVVVLVNELSASASEIFAAAIQDYRRGVIVGSVSFGKGTVQRGFRVPGPGWVQSENDLGSIHLTLQKYYRVNGGATQLKGITPDIQLPGLYEHYKVQEKNYPNALPWDEVRSANFSVADSNYIGILRQNSLQRLQQTPAFTTIQNSLHELSVMDNRYSLDITKFREERKRMREAISKIRANSIRTDSLKIRNAVVDEMELSKREQFRKDNNQAWLNRLKRDLYLSEAVFVMKDLIRIS